MSTPMKVPQVGTGTGVLQVREIWVKVRELRVSTYTTLLLLIAALSVNIALQPNFFSTYGLSSTFATLLPPALIAVAQTFVVLTGGIDLSIGASVTLAAVTAVVIMDGKPEMVTPALLAAIGVGMTCGLVNGLVVALLRLQPIIATFALSFVYSGLALLVLPKPGGAVAPNLISAYRATHFGVPATLWALLTVIVAWILLKRTRLVRHIFAIGGDSEAAYASLVPVTRVRILTYVLAGFFAGLAAIALSMNAGAGDPFLGTELALTSVAAVVIGGAALKGGRGGAIGSIIGAVILVLIGNIISFADVPTTYRQLTSGVIIIAALALSSLTSKPGKGSGR